jgi:hypothetical protein
MYRLTLLATSLLLATSAYAGQPGSEAQPAAAVTVAAIPLDAAAGHR